LQFLFVVQKIHTFASINLKHAHIKPNILFGWSYFENIINSIFGYRINCESLSRPRLTICKASHNGSLKYQGKKISDWELVHVLRIFIFIECVIELEVDIFYVFCDAIYFDFRLVYNTPGIRGAYAIHNSLSELFIKKRSFAHINTDIHLCSTNMIKGRSHLFFSIINKWFKIYIDCSPSLGLIYFLLFDLVILHSIHLSPSCFSILFNLLDAFHFYLIIYFVKYNPIGPKYAFKLIILFKGLQISHFS